MSNTFERSEVTGIVRDSTGLFILCKHCYLKYLINSNYKVRKDKL